MIKLGRVLKNYEESGALNAQIGVQEAIDEHTFLTSPDICSAYCALTELTMSVWTPNRSIKSLNEWNRPCGCSMETSVSTST